MTMNHRNGRVSVAPKGDTFRRYGTGPEAFGVRPGEVTFEVPGRFDVTVTVGHDEGASRPEATSVTISRRADGPAIGSRSVATEAHLGGLVRLAVEALSFPSPTGRGIEAIRGLMRSQRAATEQLGRFYGHDKGGRSGHDKAARAKLVKKAVAAYRKAQKEGRPTTRAVAAACEVSPGVARQLILKARATELLPPTTTTRPKL